LPVTKLTGVVIQSLKPEADGSRTWHWDASYKGLCLRVGRRDKTWSYMYRFDGKQRNHTIGKYAPGRSDHVDRKAAMLAADEINTQIESSIDPKGKTKSTKPKPAAKNSNTLKRRVKQFLKLYKRQVKASTYGQAQRLLTGVYLASYEATDVKKISRVELVELLEDMSDTPTQANRLQAYLSKFFNWCWDRGYVDPSPMVGLQKRFKEQSRKRYLSSDEIKELWKGCKALGYPLGDWCLFTLATGQRPGECRKLNRDDIHDDVWLVEGGDPKNKERHRIPLPKIARDILEKAPELEGRYVFSTTNGNKPITQGGKPYGNLYEAVDIIDSWRPHDLRRTFQTLASEELDIEPHLLGAICNQMSVAKPGVSNVYNQAKWMKPKDKALEAWNRWLMGAIK
jgi:integrase